MSETYKVEIVHIEKETPTVKTFRLKLLHDKKMNFLPGQFVVLHDKIKGKVVKRSYSISSSPLYNTYIEITLKQIEKGEMSSFMHEQIKVGDVLEIEGPKGHFTYEENMNKRICLLAGGSGISPMRSIILYCTEKELDTKIVLFYSVKTPEDIIFRKELIELEKRNENLKIVYTMTRVTPDIWKNIGRINEVLIEKEVKHIKETKYYLCGPLPFIRTIVSFLKKFGVDRKNIKRDVW